MKDALRAVRLIATDVDGVLTRGEIRLDADGRRMGTFSARDGLAVSLARQGDLDIAIVSGAVSGAVRARAAELGIERVHEGVGDKGAALAELRRVSGLEPRAVLYIGDDLNDLAAFGAAGFRVAVADAVPELRAAADWVTAHAGGTGAFREVVEAVLRAQGSYERVVQELYGTAEARQSRDDSQRRTVRAASPQPRNTRSVQELK